MDLKHTLLVDLKEKIEDTFNIDELVSLCFDLNIKHENLEYKTLRGLIREIIKYCQRRNKIPLLISQLEKYRPKINWPGISPVTQQNRGQELLINPTKKIDELDRQLDYIEARIAQLQNRKGIVSDPEEQLKLEGEIEYLKEDFHRLEDEIEAFENATMGKPIKASIDNLHKALLRLGYKKQHRTFEKALNYFSQGAFLIYGPSQDYGQNWLLNRLILKFIRNVTSCKKITIKLDRRSQLNDIRHIWREIGQQDLGLRLDECEPNQIANRLHQISMTQDILLIFKNVDGTIEHNLKELLQNLWTPVISKFNRVSAGSPNNGLYLFLLDNDGTVLNWSFHFHDQVLKDNDLETPFKIPQIEAFTKEEIEDWLFYLDSLIPDELTQMNTLDAVENIYQFEEGIPMPTFMKICDMCGISLTSQEEKWLPY